MTNYDDIRSATAAAEAEHAQTVEELVAAQGRVLSLEKQVLDLQAELAECLHPVNPAKSYIGSSRNPNVPIPPVVTEMDSYRHYFQPGDFAPGKAVPAWGRGQEAMLQTMYDQYGVRFFSISIKPDNNRTTFADPSRVGLFLDTIPDDVTVALTFFHEHDGDIKDGTITLDFYRQGCREIQPQAHARGMLFGPIHNGRSKLAGSTGWNLDPRYWRDKEPDVPCDFWGVDCYFEKYQTDWQPLADYSAEVGAPLLIGEIGAPVGAQRPAWAAEARAFFLEHSLAAMWWNMQFAGKSDYRLDDSTARAWFGIKG